MKALLVGGAGVTGRLLLQGLLDRGYQVTVMSRGMHTIDLPDGVESLIANPYDKESIPAALEGRQFELTIVTYGRLRHVAKALVGKTSRMISVGGAAPVYKGWGDMIAMNPWETTEPTPLFLSEDHPLASADTDVDFSHAVRFTEKEVMAFHERGDLNVTHYRYPAVYGPDNLCPAEWGLVRRVRDKRVPLIVPGKGLTVVCRGFYENVAHGVLLAVDQPDASAGQIYNIRDDELIHNHQWIRMAEDSLNHQFEKIDIPFSWLPEGFRATPPQLLSRDHAVMDISKIKQQLGYRDVVSAEQAMEKTLKWYMDNPLQAGCESEQNLGDPFDYTYEDKVIKSYFGARDDFINEESNMDRVKVIWKHPYQ